MGCRSNNERQEAYGSRGGANCPKLRAGKRGLRRLGRPRLGSARGRGRPSYCQPETAPIRPRYRGNHVRLKRTRPRTGEEGQRYPHEALSCRCYHGDAVLEGSRRHSAVVGHDAVEIVAQFESCREMESVQAPQLFGVKGGRSFERR
jgi:hypothetical protein